MKEKVRMWKKGKDVEKNKRKGKDVKKKERMWKERM